MSPDAPEAPSSLEPDFGSMGIYVDGRTANELNELLKRKSASAITSRDLHALSCMHYLDDEPMREAAAHFRLADADANGGTPRTVLDFGAGYAGDARVLAAEYPGVLVTCVEVQRHIHAAAARFTAMLASAHPSRVGNDDGSFHRFTFRTILTPLSRSPHASPRFLKVMRAPPRFPRSNSACTVR